MAIAVLADRSLSTREPAVRICARCSACWLNSPRPDCLTYFPSACSSRFLKGVLITSVLTASDQKILELLATHRVLTTNQLRFGLGSPERTVDYRLLRLLRLKYINRHRPYAERGSAPFHWWLTRKGSAVAGISAECKSASLKPMFLMHTASIADLYFALAWPGSGISLKVWSRDEESWESWEKAPAASKSEWICPDARAQFSASLRDVSVFFEVDRGTMDHRRLVSKVRRYCAYARSDVWQQRHGALPALLLVTTSDERAGRFLEKAAKEAANDSRLMDRIAACGVVGTMRDAASGAVWSTCRDRQKRSLSVLVREIALTDETAAARCNKVETADAVDAFLQLWRAFRKQVLSERPLSGLPEAIVEVMESLDPYGDRSFAWAQEHRSLIVETHPALGHGRLDSSLEAQWRHLRGQTWRKQSIRYLSKWGQMPFDSATRRTVGMRLLQRKCVSFRIFERCMQEIATDADREWLDRYAQRRQSEIATGSFLAMRRVPSPAELATYDERWLGMCKSCGALLHRSEGSQCNPCGADAIPYRSAASIASELRSAGVAD